MVVEAAGSIDPAARSVVASLLRPAGAKAGILVLNEAADTSSGRTAALFAHMPHVRADLMRLGGLHAVADPQALLWRVMTVAAQASPVPEFRPPDCVVPDISDPLRLLTAGLAAPHIGFATAMVQSSPGIWQRARSCGSAAGREFSLERILLGHLTACITLQGRCRLRDVAALVTEETAAMGLSVFASAAEVADVLADILLAEEGDRLEPFVPDPLAEAFVRPELACHALAAEVAIIERAWRRTASPLSRLMRY